MLFLKNYEFWIFLLTEEQIRKEMEGFIKDEDDEEEEEEGDESGSETGKRKHEDSEESDDQLEDEDYDLIEENLGVKVKRKVSLADSVHVYTDNVILEQELFLK